MAKIKFFLIIFTFCVCFCPLAFAKNLPNDFDYAYKETDISKNAVSIYIQDLNRFKHHYEHNEDKSSVPASVQKIVTMIPSIKVLGENYNFSTKLYKVNGKNEYYLQLGADPYLTSTDLKNLLKCIDLPKDTPISKLYIDDSIFDKNEWGEGWQWDDDLNPLMPKFSAYNIDKNLLKLAVQKRENQPPSIEPLVFYPTAIMNYVKNGAVDDIRIFRKNYISPNVLTFEGEVASNQEIIIPINNMKLYFELRLKEKLRENKLSYYGKFENVEVPKEGVTLIGEIVHPISLAIKDTFENSNNLVAETVFKLAGAKYTRSQGSIRNSIVMFNEFCSTNGIDTSKIKLVDGSGVSKNNLITARFLTEFLTKVAQNYGYETLSTYFPKPNNKNGTLKNRMIYLSDSLHAKTGTLSDVSALAGYIKTKKNKIYAFSILITDAKSSKRAKKMFEEYILRQVYRSL